MHPSVMYGEQKPFLVVVGMILVLTLITAVVCNAVYSINFDDRKKGDPRWTWEQANFLWLLKWLAIGFTVIAVLKEVEAVTGWKIFEEESR